MNTKEDMLINRTTLVVDTILEVANRTVSRLHPEFSNNPNMNDLMQGAITSELSAGINRLYEDSIRGVEA